MTTAVLRLARLLAVTVATWQHHTAARAGLP